MNNVGNELMTSGNDLLDQSNQAIEAVTQEGTLGKTTKGLLIGAAVVGVGAVAFGLYKKFKKPKQEIRVAHEESEEDQEDMA